MVEGPGCKLKGEKLKSTVVGQKVKNVGGNVIENRPKKDQDKPTPYHALVGRSVIDVRTLGKELFLFLDSGPCLRVHFLMAGYIRFNNKQTDPDEGARKTQPESPRLELQMTRDEVSFYLCSVELRDAQDTRARWDRMITLDVCWSRFDAKRSADTIMEVRNEERLVADVIMDQEVMPGVGNIIKNEGCFDAGVNPLTKIKDLSREHVVTLVKMLRDFSTIFYNCRKTGKPLHKFYKMYRFSKCKQCDSRVTKCKPGEYQRGTYFCPRCQDNRLRSGPTKGSLLGWAKSGGQTGSEWTCSQCTLLNKPGCLRCSVCGGEKEPRCESNFKSNIVTQLAVPQMSGKRKSTVNFEESEDAKRFKQEPEVTEKITKSVGKFKFTSFRNVNQSEIKRDENSQTIQNTKVLKQKSNPICESQNILSINNDNNVIKDEPPAELCKGHKRPCVKKTVSKEGPNKLRLFWTCALPKAKSCNYFSWADLHHPKCRHGDISLLREVYKMNQNNGREFFICPRPKGRDQCDFFQWNDI